MSSSSVNHSCPLCDSPLLVDYHRDQNRDYKQCSQCQLVFVDRQYLLGPEQEKAEYDLHRNSVDDSGYRKFLSRLLLPMQLRLQPGAEGLEFGCGPGPVLSVMLADAGYKISVYDIYYYNDASVLAKGYDFITATEVVEHLYRPGQVLQQLWDLLPQGGYLGLMTKLLIDLDAFTTWHYKNDPTHVCFYSRACFKYIAEMLGADLSIIGNDVIILTKRDE